MMRMAFESSVIFTPVVELFAMLTNMAEICVDNIRYDAANGIVEILMKRRDIIEQNKKGCLGLIWLRPSYIWGPSWIDSILTIRQVVNMEMEVDDLLVKECNSRFTVMMGVKIEKDKIYLHSLEEASGKTLCQIIITVRGINIEVADQAQK